jgi:hypothetical protein
LIGFNNQTSWEIVESAWMPSSWRVEENKNILAFNPTADILTNDEILDLLPQSLLQLF